VEYALHIAMPNRSNADAGKPMQIVWFFLLAYLFSWFGILGNYLSPSDNWPSMNPLGPLMAAPLAIWWFGGGAALRQWWQRILQFRAPLWVYAAAFLIPLTIILVSIGGALLLGTPSRPLTLAPAVEYLVLIPLIVLAGPMPEELSFRGHGQHELQKSMSPLSAALWIGLGVAIWHIPLYFVEGLPWPIFFALPAVSVVYAWFYQRSGTLWPLVVLHWVQNYFGGNLLGTMFAPEDSTVWLSLLAAGYISVAAFLVWREGPALGRR
jgi:uncharacterized protein